MRLDQKGLDLLHKREGLRLKPYLDVRGIPTIAFGNTYYTGGKKVTMQDKPLTLAQAKELGKIVANDFAKFVDAVITSKVNQNQFDACVSFAYNIGKYGFAESDALKLINKNPNNPLIANAFMNWRRPSLIIERRKAEIAQYFGT